MSWRTSSAVGELVGPPIQAARTAGCVRPTSAMTATKASGPLRAVSEPTPTTAWSPAGGWCASGGAANDGTIEIRLGNSMYLYADVLPMYENAGVMLPTVGDEVTLHGIVRWDAGHDGRELLPVDWIGP